MKSAADIRLIVEELHDKVNDAKATPGYGNGHDFERVEVLAEDLEALLDELCAGAKKLPGRLDGTGRLCLALYGRAARPRDYLGGSEAKMLHDAADKLEAANTRGGAPCGS